MKRRFVAFWVAVCLFALAGCSAKDMDTSLITITADGQAVGETLLLEVEESKAFDLSLPVEESSLTVASDSEALQIADEGGGIVLTGTIPGDYTLNLTVEAKGYNPAVLTLPVKVEPHPMNLSVTAHYPGTGGSEETGYTANTATLTRGQSMAFLLEASAGEADMAVTVSDEAVASCTLQEDGQYLVEALYPGETTLTFTAFKENYTTAEEVWQLVVEPTAAGLGVSAAELGITIGETKQLGLNYQQGGSVSLNYDNTGIDVVQSGSALSVTGLKAGRYTLTLTCTAEGYKTATAQVAVTVSQPTVDIAVVSSVELRAGESRQAALRTTPADADITVTAAGGVKATYQNGNILIEGTAQGSGTVTVTAAKEGFLPKTVTVSVAVTAALPKVDTTTYAGLASQIISYTNQERQAAGLSTLAHISDVDVPAAIRAQEASVYWSHTRPDGRDCMTVFDDCGLSYRGRGENLSETNFGPYSADAKTIVDALMDSKTHRENILRPEFTGIGVGIYYANGMVYAAQLFVCD